MTFNSAFATAELQEVSASSFLQPVWVSLNVSTALQYVNCSNQF